MTEKVNAQMDLYYKRNIIFTLYIHDTCYLYTVPLHLPLGIINNILANELHV